jgi:hypothetical protein
MLAKFLNSRYFVLKPLVSSHRVGDGVKGFSTLFTFHGAIL